MVATSNRYKKVHLIRLESIKELGSDAGLLSESSKLIHLIKTAWSAEVNGVKFSDTWKTRNWGYSPSDALILSTAKESRHAFFGEIVLVEPNGLLQVADMSDGSNLSLSQIPTGANQDPVKAVSYFYIFGNYLLFIDDGIRLAQLARYISWMFGTTFSKPSGLHVLLTPKIEFSGSSAKQISAKKLLLKPAKVGIPTPLESAAVSKGAKDVSIKEGNIVWDILHIIGAGRGKFSNMPDEADGEIELQIMVKFKEKGKLLPITNLPLNEIAKGFDDDEMILEGDSGKSVGKISKVHHEAKISMNGSRMIPSSVIAAFEESRKIFLENGAVSV